MADLIVERIGRAGVLTLNRPAALNALTHQMACEMMATLQAWRNDPDIERIIVKAAGDRAFCAGGDIRDLYQKGLESDPEIRRFYVDEYRLNVLIKQYPKPYVALIDGIVMGGGVGISVHGQYRIGTENTVFAMPETGIGLFPDVGATYFLPRMKGEMGLYLGLTGARLKGLDAQHYDVLTHHTKQSHLDDVFERLCTTPDLHSVLKDMSQQSSSVYQSREAEIDRLFGAETLDLLLAGLDDEGTEFALETLATLAQKSPTSLAITFRQLRKGRDLSFADCMQLEFAMVTEILKNRDFFEGVRALIIDKDLAPKWSPPAVSDLEEEAVERYFASLLDPLDFSDLAGEG